MKKTLDFMEREGITVKGMYNGLSQRNKDFIEKFIEHKKGYVTDPQLDSCRYFLSKFAYVLEKDFDKATKDEITKVGGIILQSPYATKTKQDIFCYTKLAYKFLFGENEYYPREVLGLKRPNSRTALKLPKDMLSEEQVYQMIKVCTHVRDKFFIALCGLDGALRPCEGRNIKWGDIKKDKYGHYVIIHTAKKSGNKETRSVRIIKSEPYFIQWSNVYPKERKDDSYLFINVYTLRKINKGATAGLFRRLRKRLNFDMRVYPYLMRHSLITRMSKDPKISIPVLKKFIGHSLRSNTIAEYQHFGDDDTKDMQLEMNGIKKLEEDVLPILQPITCPKCQKPNEYDAEFCGFCNMALSQRRLIEGEETIKIMDKKMDAMHKRQEALLLELRRLRKQEEIKPQVVAMVKD